jgi:urease accessory protein UreH
MSLFNALADDIREPAAEFGAKASDMETKTRRLDAELRALVAEMYEIDPQQTQEQLGQLREAVQAQSEIIQQFLDQMTQVEKVLRMAALASTKLRTALRPMTTGLRSLGTTVRVFNSWDSIDPSVG